MKSIEDLEQEIEGVDREAKEVESKILRWKQRLQQLHEKKNSLKKIIDKIKSDSLASKDWAGTDYEWYDDVKKQLKEVFKIKSFRHRQLSAINSTMSGEHALVVMPTGAGKSLCYQLPALLKPGLTLVISPLISLMEDQVRSLTKRKIPAMLMTSTSTKEETNKALNALKDKTTTIKLLYVTPERLAKSKRFMANLQKCYEEGRLQRIAIDEVHCCSQWGHDFRPDYKRLGILTNTFPNIPILGLTATATSDVLTDVQKMLNISGCLVIKSTFNRPNLFYQILEKPTSQEECLTLLESLLKYRYKGKSGIIYTCSIKDAEDLTEGLRKRGLKIGCYHAYVEADIRTKVHTKWHDGYYQAIVATVAFGMGIDKADVRFVIHHSLSKSMENYYQESGRAGRDDLRAECVTLYKMQDIFKISTMVLSSVQGKDHLYGMIKYCLNGTLCRRQLIAKHFDEDWGSSQCNKMCDTCCNPGSPVKELDLQTHCRTLASILSNAENKQTKLTAQKLLDAWFLKGPVNLRHDSVKPNFSRNLGEDVIVYLLTEAYLEEHFHYTPHNTIVYIKKGPNLHLVNDCDFNLKMPIRKYFQDTFNIKESAPLDYDTNIVDIEMEFINTGSRNSNGEPLPKKLKQYININ